MEGSGAPAVANAPAPSGGDRGFGGRGGRGGAGGDRGRGNVAGSGTDLVVRGNVGESGRELTTQRPSPSDGNMVGRVVDEDGGGIETEAEGDDVEGDEGGEGGVYRVHTPAQCYGVIASG